MVGNVALEGYENEELEAEAKTVTKYIGALAETEPGIVYSFSEAFRAERHVPAHIQIDS